MSDAAIVVDLPAGVRLAGGPAIRWRVGVGDAWGAPGQRIPTHAGSVAVILRGEIATPNLAIKATFRIPVNLASGGVTRLQLTSLLARAERYTP